MERYHWLKLNFWCRPVTVSFDISFNIENIYSNYNSAIAQVVERPTKKHEVPGSIPTNPGPHA